MLRVRVSLRTRRSSKSREEQQLVELSRKRSQASVERVKNRNQSRASEQKRRLTWAQTQSATNSQKRVEISIYDFNSTSLTLVCARSHFFGSFRCRFFSKKEKCEKSSKDDLQVNLMSQKGTKHDQRRHNRLLLADDDDDGKRARHKAQRSQFSVSFFGAQDKAN